MLASTVQFSNNNRNPHPTIPATTGTPAGPETSEGPRKNKQEETVPGPLPARPLRTQQRTYSHPTINQPVPTHPNKGMDHPPTPKSRRNDHVVLDIDQQPSNRTS